MRSQVFLLPKGGSVIADSWQAEEDASDAARERWERSASVWPRLALRGGPVAPLENFICMDGDPLESGYDSDALGTQLVYARQHGWGADLYVVVDQRYGMQPGQVEARPARIEWFKTMSKLGVVDVIELPLPLPLAGDGGGHQPKLRFAAARSRERAAIIDAHARPGTWKCIFQRQPGPIQKSFLSPFLTAAPAGDPEENYLLVLDGSGGKPLRKSQRDFVGKMADASPDGQLLVAYFDETGEEPPEDLRELCDARGLGLIPNSFRGLFELYFFIWRLADESQRRLAFAWRAADWSEAVEAVAVAPRPTFKARARHLSMLVTHAFAYGDEPTPHAGPECDACEPESDPYCVEAARDFYELTKDLPFGTAVHVHPAVTCEVLTGVLAEIGDITVWVHIGHGRQGEGLHESGGEDDYAPAEKWLSCFERHQGPLALACFAACESKAVARYFAEHGAGVSIGFAEEVPLEDCRLVTREVVKVALNSDGDRDAILRTFERSRRATDAAAVAFCANQ